LTVVGSLAVAISVGVSVCFLALALAPAAAAPARPAAAPGHSASKCPVDHHVYASVQSAKRSGSSVTVKAKLGKADCGRDGRGYKFGKSVKTLTVPKSAVVKVLKNIVKSVQVSRIPVRQLPHYVNRSYSKNDGNLFQLAGPHKAVKKLTQIFLS
jgi:hypothetical protein